MELRLVLTRPLSPSECREVSEELKERLGAKYVECIGREVRVYSPGFTIQFLPILLGIFGALGVGIVSIILANKMIRMGSSLEKTVIELAPLIAGMLFALGVIIVVSKR